MSTARTARPGPTGVQTVAAERIEENGDGRMNVIYCMSSDSELVESDQQTVVSGGMRWSRRFALLDEIDGRWKVVRDDLIDDFDGADCAE